MTTHLGSKKSFSKVVLAVGAAIVIFASTSQANANNNCVISGTAARPTGDCTLSGSDVQWVAINSGSGTLTITDSGNLTVSGTQTINIASSASGWTVQNQGTIKNTKTDTSNSANGITINGTSSTINNSGTIQASRASNRSGSAAIWVATASDSTTTIGNSGSGSILGADRGIKQVTGTIKVTNSGSNASISGANYAIEINSGSGHTINNQSGASITGGTGVGVAAKVTLDTLINEDTSKISGSNVGIYLGKTASGVGTITTLTNSGSIGGGQKGIAASGTITTLTNSASGSILGTASSSNAIHVVGTITTLNNSGAISTTHTNADAIYISGSGSIATLNVTSGGYISGGKNGFNIVNFSGSGQSIGTLKVSGTGAVYGANGAGVSNSGKIGTIAVEGTSSLASRFILSTRTEADDANGSEEDPGYKAPEHALIQGSAYGVLSNGTIDSISVTSGASITGGVGIANTTSTTLKGTMGTITVSGSGSTVSGTTSGLTNAGTITKIQVTDSGSIVGGTNGIVNTGTIESIEVGAGSSIHGDTYGISNTGTIRSIIVHDGGSIGNIYNSGTISKAVADSSEAEDEVTRSKAYSARVLGEEELTEACKNAAICLQGEGNAIGTITNEVVTSGTTKSAGLIDGDIYVAVSGVDATGVAIQNSSGASIQGSIFGASGAISSLHNAGHITGDIVIEATNGQKITLSNSTVDGISGTITFNAPATARNEDKATLEITEWNTKIVSSKDANGQSVPALPEVHIQGSGGQVVVKNVSITEVDGQVAKGTVDLNNVFFYDVSDDTSNSQGITIENASMSESLSSAGWSGYFDKENGVFQTNFSTERSVGGIMGQALAGQLARRDFFLDSVVTQTAADALYNRLYTGNSGLVFVKPYVSFDSLEAGTFNFSGDTVGVVGGATGFLSNHIVTGFIGYEKTSLDSRYKNARMALGLSTVYGGVSVARVITSSEQFDTFGRVTGKLSYTRSNIERDLTAELSTGATNTFAFGADAQLGMNYKFTKTGRIVPMLGVGYSAGSTKAYEMQNSVSLQDSYQPGDASIPYLVGSVTWHQVWMDYLRSYMTLGVRYNLSTEMKSDATFGGATVSGAYNLVDMYEYFSLNINMKLTKHSEFSYGYTGVFDKLGQSHNLLAQYKYVF